MDKRAERTKGYLREALMRLLDLRPLERITVRELVDYAGVSKNSFYNYYGNMTCLVQDCFAHDSVFFGSPHLRRADFATGAEAARTICDQRAEQLVFYRAHPNFAREILMNVGVSPYYETCETLEVELNIDHLTFQYGEPADAQAARIYESAARYIFQGTYGLFRAWYREGMRETVESVVKDANYLSFQVAAGVVSRPIEPVYRQVVEEWRWPL